MDMVEFLGIETLGAGRFRVAVTNQLITPGNFLYGGCGLAACVQALELESQRPLAWATAQFTSYAGPGDILDITTELVATGKNVTQARSVARVGDREVLFTLAALGTGTESAGTFVTMPDVAQPEACPLRESPHMVKDTLFAQLEIRLASGRGWKELDGTPGSSKSSFWIKLPRHHEPTAATLSIYGDSVANGILQVTGRPMMGRSLDNTLRIGTLVPTEWVLADIRMDAYEHGFTQGVAYLWSQDGTLLATASQTQTMKRRPETDGSPLWGGQRPVG